MITRKILEYLHKNGLSTSTQICNGLKEENAISIRACLNWMHRTGRIEASENPDKKDSCRLLFKAIALPGVPKTLDVTRKILREATGSITAAELTERIGCSRRSSNLALKTLVDLGEVEKTSALQKQGCVEYYVLRRNETTIRPLTAVDVYDKFIGELVKQGLHYPQVFFRGLLLRVAE